MEQQHMLHFFQSSKPVIKISNFFYSTSKMDPEESQIVKKGKCIPTILEFHFSFRGCSLGKISPSLVSCVEKREEFMILPVGAGSFREALQIGAEVAICTNYSINDWTTSAIFRGIFEKTQFNDPIPTEFYCLGLTDRYSKHPLYTVSFKSLEIP